MKLWKKVPKKQRLTGLVILLFCVLAAATSNGFGSVPHVQAQTGDVIPNTYTTSEGNATVQITVTLDSDPAGTATIDWATQDSTATAPSDYIANSGTITFTAGNRTQTITISLVNDAVAELDELFRVNLTNPTGGITIGSPSFASVTIKDNDLPIIQFSTSADTVNEGDGKVTVSVTVNNTAFAFTPVTIDYATQDGSATSSGDYTTTAGTLTFASPSTTQSFDVPINNDTLSESSEKFYINLQNPVNATIGSNNQFTVNITDNDASGTTPTPQIFADVLEPNNNFTEASETAADAADLCNLTFYPPGDQDYFRWWGKAGITYTAFTSDLDPALDTVLDVYDSSQSLIASNDDLAPGLFQSEVRFTASADGYYYARVTNKTPIDPINKLYCFEVDSSVSPTSTPPPGFPADADECEYNSTIDFACLFILGETKSNLNFVPTVGSSQDTDIYKLWVKPGIYYTCETTIPAGSAADTNMIFWDSNGNPFNPWLGNDDKVAGGIDFGSEVSYLATYTGWLFIVIGPVNIPPLEEAALHEYDLTCTAVESTPTPTPSPTTAFTGGTGGTGGGFSATATPLPTVAFPTPLPTATPIDFSPFFTVTPAPPPVVQFQPLPTSTPAGGGAQAATINVTLYYDSNNNFLPELTEGIVNAAVSLYDNGTGQLISFGHTNETGVARFTAVNATGAIRVVVPFLNYSQVVLSDNAEILVRVAPQPLPIGIP